MSKSKTAADKAVEKSQKKTEVEKTPKQIITDIVLLVSAGLYVPVRSVKVLLEAYEAATLNAKKLSDALAAADDKVTELMLRAEGAESQVAELTTRLTSAEDAEVDAHWLREWLSHYDVTGR